MPNLLLEEKGVARYSQYKIALRNFSDEPQRYEYQLDSELFKQLDGSADIQKGAVDVILTVRKGVAAFEFLFQISGTVSVSCDRCLDDIAMDVNTENKLYVKFGKEYSEENDEIIIIPEEDGEINVVWFIYEFIALSLPLKRVHAPGKCNKAMSSALNKYKDTSVNEAEEDEQAIDPRWEALKGLQVDESDE